jgi:hypothetical protein
LLFVKLLAPLRGRISNFVHCTNPPCAEVFRKYPGRFGVASCDFARVSFQHQAVVKS